MGRGSSTIEKTNQTALSLGLVGTQPFYIANTSVHQLADAPGYILYVLTQAVIGAGTITNVEGDSLNGVSLAPGYYHIYIEAIQLDSGTAIVYRGNV